MTQRTGRVGLQTDADWQEDPRMTQRTVRVGL